MTAKRPSRNGSPPSRRTSARGSRCCNTSSRPTARDAEIFTGAAHERRLRAEIAARDAAAALLCLKITRLREALRNALVSLDTDGTVGRAALRTRREAPLAPARPDNGLGLGLAALAFRSVVLADARNAVLEDYGEAIGRCQSQEEFNELLEDTKWQLRTITEYEEPEEDEDA